VNAHAGTVSKQATAKHHQTFFTIAVW